MKTQTTKSLCKSCSNRVIVKYHNNESKYHKCYCILDIVKSRWNSAGTLALDSIVDKCSFHNKSIMQFKKKQSPEINENGDSDINEDGSFKNGVTFTNISGALLP